MAYVRAEGWSLATEGGKNIDDIRECYEQYCQVLDQQMRSPLLNIVRESL